MQNSLHMIRICVLQEWKERYGNPRDDYTARNRSSHEMKETSYSDTVAPSNNRRGSTSGAAHFSDTWFVEEN